MPVIVGVSCVPSPELSPSFAGFSEREVTVDEGNAACGAGVCLVNHFRGLTSCRFGQGRNGMGVVGTAGCTVPGSDAGVRPDAGAAGEAVSAQCVDRASEDDVTCSCRCANAEGKTDDGGSYCACPGGFVCAQVVPELVAKDARAGGYCVRAAAVYDADTACSSSCDFAQQNCTPPGSPGRSPGSGAHATTYSLAILKLSNGICLPSALPTGGDGRAQCDVVYVLADADACASHAGLTAANPLVASAIRTQIGGAITPTQPVCILAQLAPMPCASSSSAGFCYLTAPAAPNGCAESIDVSPPAAPPAGALAALACP